VSTLIHVVSPGSVFPAVHKIIEQRTIPLQPQGKADRMEGPRKKMSGIFPIGSVSKKHLEEQIQTMATTNKGPDQKLQELRNKLLQQQQINQQSKRILQDTEKNLSRFDDEISKLREDKVTLHGQIQELSKRLAVANRETETVRSELQTSTEQLSASRQEVLSVQVQFDILNATNNDIRQRLSAHEARISTLDEEKIDLLQQKEYLGEMVVWLKKQHMALGLAAFDQHASTMMTKREAEPKLDGGRDLTAELHRKMESLRLDNVFLNQTCAELRTQISVLRNNIPRTLRSFLVMRYLDMMYPLSTDDTKTEPSELIETWYDTKAQPVEPTETLYPLNLPQASLDMVYSLEEFDQVAAVLRPGPTFKAFYGRIQLRTCALCTKPRIGGDFHDSPLNWINEFPARGSFFTCCSAKVCRKCFVGYLIGVVQYEWWHHPGSLQWLFCPVAGCERALEIRCEADFQLCLERNHDAEAEEHVKMLVSFCNLVFSLSPVLASNGVFPDQSTHSTSEETLLVQSISGLDPSMSFLS
jgi:hypothetical protein